MLEVIWMVNLKDDNQPQKIDDAITKRTFLSSLLSWYPKGVPCTVESISKIFADYSGDPSLCVTLEIEDMERCRMRDIGDDGKAIQIVDELGEKRDKIIEGDVSGMTVPLFFKLKYDEDDEMGDLFHISNWGAIFPLLNYGCIKREMVPPGNEKGFSITHDEIVDALDGLNFIAKSERVVPSNSKIKPFNKLIVGNKKREL